MRAYQRRNPAMEAQRRKRLKAALVAERGFEMTDEIASAVASQGRGLPLTTDELVEATLRLRSMRRGVHQIAVMMRLPEATVRQIFGTRK